MKHYILVNESNQITDGWSDAVRPGYVKKNAICITEDGGYQFRLSPDGMENPLLQDFYGIPLYLWDGEAVVSRPEDELEQERERCMEKEDLQSRIIFAEQRLDGDYRYKKRIDGEYSDNEWAPIAAQRQAWRAELRELIEMLEGMEA
ncbi:MAG: hypothetical protein FWH04_07360 [Oscillospiraceae bacterium]|nr:hypothetical protein [Oscillospiraceae bacterium]